MVINRQQRVRLDLRGARLYVRRVRAALRLGRKNFGVCFVDDARIAELNRRYRRKPRPTDVLSFPWKSEAPRAGGDRDFRNYLGDIVISAETARRNARAAGHSTAREIRWLILHGTLHLLGYDHETDDGKMTRLERALRHRLETL
jgi:probable rRNA maturation factor